MNTIVDSYKKVIKKALDGQYDDMEDFVHIQMAMGELMNEIGYMIIERYYCKKEFKDPLKSKEDIIKKLECAPTGRITYKELGELIQQMDEEQQMMDVTIEENYNTDENECFAGEFIICGQDHDSLDDFHPVIRSPLKED